MKENCNGADIDLHTSTKRSSNTAPFSKVNKSEIVDIVEVLSRLKRDVGYRKN
jgi:hypothetical protein